MGNQYGSIGGPVCMHTYGSSVVAEGGIGEGGWSAEEGESPS